jgi:UPF0755 protein
VVADLVAAGLVNEPELLRDYLRFYGLDSRLQAGSFTLSGEMSLEQLATTIADGSARDIVLGFLPGMRLEEMAEYLLVTSPANIDADEFLSIARRQAPFRMERFSFLAAVPNDATLQGYLAPGQYSVPPSADAAYLVNSMLRKFDTQVTPAIRQAFGARGLQLHEAVTLASIIEREAIHDDERPVVASVYLNRINDSMPLQADPTVQYAVGYQNDKNSWWKVPLSLSDLRLDHPYNTYVIGGLPPGPIANPGLASLQAVADPAETDYYFFVLDCLAASAGRHIFSRTFDEHLDNVQRCQ